MLTQRGFSLVELMVAMALGLVVTGAVFALYLTSTLSYAQDERYARMQENGRYALKVVAEDLRMADFWGKITAPETIASAVAPPGGCAGSIDLLNAGRGLLFNRYHDAEELQFNPCADVTGVHAAGTDMVVVKRVQKQPGATTGLRLRSNGVSGTFVDSGSPNTAAGEADWGYQPRLYFVRNFSRSAADGTPALCRLQLRDAPHHLDFQDVECPAEGIEDLHILFGVDTDQDGAANRYTSAPALDDMEVVVSARIYILARSLDADRQYTNTKAFSLGDVLVPALNDGFYRQVYTTTVALRNTANMALLSN